MFAQKFLAVFATILCVSAGVKAQFPASFEDAPLHCVTFADAQEGWAAGDAGVIWHTIDGGKTWERQKSGTRASLRALHFLTPYTGYAVGRVEQPYGQPATGVVLKTTDGGLTWTEAAASVLPGLHAVHFSDDKTGTAAGASSGAFPSGLFKTTDGGETWNVIPGSKATTWNTLSSTGMVAGANGAMGTVGKNEIQYVPGTAWGERNIRAMATTKDFQVVVGDGGLVATSTDSQTWARCELPTTLAKSINLHAVTVRGTNIWAVGKPGTVVFHSTDAGKTWAKYATNQTMPLNGICMVSDTIGTAVGELGTILNTTDGGKTWKVSKCGGQKAGALLMAARPECIPLDAVAMLGAKEGYFCTAITACTANINGLNAAMRSCGGIAAEGLWMFPNQRHLDGIKAETVLAYWDSLHGGGARQELVRQLVIAIRTWKPEGIICESSANTEGVDQAVAFAVQEAIKQAADSNACPELKAELGLEAHTCRVIAAVANPATSAMVWDYSEFNMALGNDVRDFCEHGVNLLANRAAKIPEKRGFIMLAGETKTKKLEDCFTLARGGSARRAGEMTALPEAFLNQRKAFATTRRGIEKLSESSTGDQGEKVLAALRKSLAGMPEDVACRTAYRMGETLIKNGQWGLAREVFAFVADQFAAHPEGVVAAKWLVMYHASGEVTRRMELGQINPLPARMFDPLSDPVIKVNNQDKPNVTKPLYRFATADAQRVWYRYALDLESKLLVHGPLHARDPFVVAALEVAKEKGAVADRPARAIMNLAVNKATTRPKLDGLLNDDCWKAQPCMINQPKDYGTKVQYSYDDEFLYVAITASHPKGLAMPKSIVRERDTNLNGYDRVEINIDVDGDGSTAFTFAVDQRGKIAESCWGDVNWNPKWYVAFETGQTEWCAELAIPLVELTGAKPENRHWQFQAQRLVPGVGQTDMIWTGLGFAK